MSHDFDRAANVEALANRRDRRILDENLRVTHEFTRRWARIERRLPHLGPERLFWQRRIILLAVMRELGIYAPWVNFADYLREWRAPYTARRRR